MYNIVLCIMLYVIHSIMLYNILCKKYTLKIYNIVHYLMNKITRYKMYIIHYMTYNIIGYKMYNIIQYAMYNIM